MGKALVIRNVDFAANALTTVTLEQDIPCTGIALSDSTLNLTSLEPVTLTATVTPVDTTDALTWASSDTSVATVVNGVVTPLKAGSVTITATCGSRSATCAVSIRVFIDPHMLYQYYFSSAKASGLLETIRIEGPGTTYGASVITTGSGRHVYQDATKLDGEHAYPIMMPTGMTSVAITLPNQNMKVAVSWCDSTQTSSYENDTIKCLQTDGVPYDVITPGSRIVAVPDISGVDCFYICTYLAASGGTNSQELLDQITVEALYS